MIDIVFICGFLLAINYMLINIFFITIGDSITGRPEVRIEYSVFVKDAPASEQNVRIIPFSL